MIRKIKTPYLVSLACCIPAAAALHAQQRPNILYIMTDQQCVDMIAALNGENSAYVSTPNLDRLVNSGYTFTNTYSASPLSVPSRFALITGTSPLEFGVRGNSPDLSRQQQVVDHAAEYAMGNIFRKAGYKTYYGGKIHLPFADGKKLKGSTDRYGFELIEESSREQLAVTASRFLLDRKNKKEKNPFLLYLSFINPHDICEESWLKIQPDNPKAQDLNELPLVTLKPIHEVLDSMGDEPFTDDSISNLPKNPGPMKGHILSESRWEDTKELTPEAWRKYRWVYFRLVEHVDGLIGQVLDALDQSGLKENTVIVFTSDHGEMLGSHGLRGKNILFEECMKVPFVIVGKGVPNKIDASTLVCNGYDLLPTMCDIASIEAPAGLRGESLWGVATGKQTAPERDYVFIENDKSFSVIDTHRNKYTRYDKAYENGLEIFVNLDADPLEMRNRIKKPENQEIVAKLRDICIEELQSRNFVEPEFKKERKHIKKVP